MPLTPTKTDRQRMLEAIAVIEDLNGRIALAEAKCAEAVQALQRMRADRDAVLIDKADWKTAHTSVARQVDTLVKERVAFVDRIAALTRELADERNGKARP